MRPEVRYDKVKLGLGLGSFKVMNEVEEYSIRVRIRVRKIATRGQIR